MKSFYDSLIARAGRRMKQLVSDVELWRLRMATIPRLEFLSDVHYAVENGLGYAAGKIGFSQQHWMYYPILLNRLPAQPELDAFHRELHFHGLNQTGIFPADPEFYLRFNEFYIKKLERLDCLGICFRPWEPQLFRHYRLPSKLIHYFEQEPDRSRPSNEGNCYLRFFRGKRLLLVCPFASLLKERFTRETFEGVWAKTGKKWFEPADVQAVEFPYGFSPSTHEKFVTAISLYDWICARMDEHDYDITLIAASGLGIPLAVHAKQRGKIAIELGGHLQVLCGVIGQRWRTQTEYGEHHFNDCWINMPERYKPKETNVCDSGAYW